MKTNINSRKLIMYSSIVVLFLMLGSVGCHMIKPGEQNRQEDATGTAREHESKPRVVFTSTSIDLGEAHQGDRIGYKFRIRNEGDADLKIISAQPCDDCDNVAVVHNREIIAPGAEDEIIVLILTDEMKGQYVRTVDVSTNDPDAGITRLKLTGTIELSVDVFPRNTVEFTIEKGIPQTKYLALINHTSEELRILSVENPFEGVSVSFEPYSEKQWKELMMKRMEAYGPAMIKTPDKADYIVSVRFEPDAKVGEYSDDVVLKTGLTKHENVKIRVKAVVKGPIKMVPDIAFWPETGGTDISAATRMFSLVHSERKRFRIKEITCEENIFTFEYFAKGPFAYRIAISLTGVSHKDHYTGLIKIHTNDPEQPLIILPYRIQDRSHSHGHSEDDDDHDHDHDHD